MTRFRLLLISFLILSFIRVAAETPEILILHSYHEGFKWTNDINDAIIGSLENTDFEYELYVEYMDSKREQIDWLFPALNWLYAKKYEKGEIDLIISSDNNAFNFLKIYRNRIFGEVPVVFCGLNYFTDEQLTGFSRVTGVTEKTDLIETIEMILKIQPDATQIVGVTDIVPTGQLHKQEFLDLRPRYQDRVKLTSLDSLAEEELKSELGSLSSDTAVLYLSYFKSRDGMTYDSDKSVSLVSRSTDCPVYTLWDWGIGPGAVGGVVTSGGKQGEKAAEIALRILSGVPVEEIPVITKSPNVPLFDYEQLPKIPATLNDLPPKSIVINRPPSFYRDNKVLIWAVISIFLLLVTLLLTLSYDLFKRRKLQITLREQKTILEDTLDNIPLFVFWKDREGNVLGSNKPFREKYGARNNDGIPNETVAPLFSEDEAKCFADLEREAESTGETIYFREVQVKDFTRKERDYIVTVIPFDTADSPLHQIQLIQDITQRRELQIQLKQSQKMEALGRLSGGIAHDFNNMLTAIIGAAELIKQDPHNDEERDAYLDMIFETSDRAHELISGLLSYSRKAPLCFSPIDINVLLTDSVRLLERTIKKTVRIGWEGPAEDLTVSGDKSMLQSAILNLGINADDAMPYGGNLSFSADRIGAHEIDLESFKPESDHYMKLTVRDTGCGIEEEELEKLFDPFYTTKAPGKGTGLGLAGVYGCILSHKGRISVSSRPAKGTAFEILLPLLTP